MEVNAPGSPMMHSTSISSNHDVFKNYFIYNWNNLMIVERESFTVDIYFDDVFAETIKLISK